MKKTSIITSLLVLSANTLAQGTYIPLPTPVVVAPPKVACHTEGEDANGLVIGFYQTTSACRRDPNAAECVRVCREVAPDSQAGVVVGRDHQ